MKDYHCYNLLSQNLANEKIGQALRKLRETEGLHLRQVEGELSIDPTILSKIE